MSVIDYIVIAIAVAGMGLVLYNMRFRDQAIGGRIRAITGSIGEEEVIYDGRRLRPIVYVADEVIRDDTGTLGERLANLARAVRLDVTYSTSLFYVEKSRLLAMIEDELKRAEFAYSATRNVRYQERLKFLRSLYYDVARSHAPYAYRYSVIVWIPPGDKGAEARAEAFKSMVEAETGVRLRRAGKVMEGLVPSGSGLLTSREAYAAFLANIGEEPGIVVGRDREERLIVLRWPEDFETHVGVFGPTGRGKTVLLAGVSAQLGARSESRLDPFSVIVVDPKGDLARLVAPMATRYHKPGRDWCVPLPRVEGLAEEIAGEILSSRPSVSVTACRGTLLERGLVVYDLSGLPNEDRDVAASLIVASLALEASESPLPGRVVVVVDEAWRTVLASSRHLKLAIREGRSRGLSVIYATQSPSDMPGDVISNTGTVIVFGGYTRAYTEAARILGLDDARTLLTLPVGTAMVKLRESAPVEVRILGFHEYVKRGAPARSVESGEGVSRNGQEAEAAEGREGVADIQKPGPYTPWPGEVPAALEGDPEG